MPHIGLTLSGGGFRATLFHLGVVRFLREAGRLKDVTHVTSVSGGSILAAHLVLNWERYNDPADTAENGYPAFQKIAGDLLAFVRSDLRGRVVRKWLAALAFPVPVVLSIPRVMWTGAYARTALLQAGYEKLYKGKTLGDLAAPGRPGLHVLATSMTTGQLVSFGGGRVRIHDGTGGAAVPHDDVSAKAVPVAYAVAASSAFPPLFPPALLDHDVLGVEEGQFPLDHYLGDGGVFDNLGIRKLLWVLGKERPGLVVLSDAQRAFGMEYGNDYSFALFRGTRSADLLMNRVSDLEKRALTALTAVEEDNRLHHCRLAETLDPDPAAGGKDLSEAEQRAVQQIRTDLDEFLPDEINGLLHHGWAVARYNWDLLRQKGVAVVADSRPVPYAPWHPVPPGRGAGFRIPVPRRKAKDFVGRLRAWAVWPYDAVKKGRLFHRSWAALFFWGWVLIYFVVVPGVVLADRYISLRMARKAAEADAVTQKKKADDQKKIADEQTRLKVESEHVAKKVLLVRLLAEAALADTPPELKERRTAWLAYRTKLRGEGIWFGKYLDPENPENDKRQLLKDLDAALAGDEVGPDVGPLVLRFAEFIRGWINPRNGSTPAGYAASLNESRSVLYTQAIETVKAIAQSKTYQDTPWLRKRFWRLYWGDLVLVERPAVSGAMIKFKDALEDWKKIAGGVPEPALRAKLIAAAELVEEKMTAELKDSTTTPRSP